MKSTLQIQPGLHVAIIMDGNGRWATQRGLPRLAGHRAGVEALRPIVEAAPDLGVGVLTVYAFSADNWRRPPQEVNALMGLLKAYLRTDRRRFVESGARLSVIGRRDRLPAAVLAEIAEVEAASAGGEALHVRVALDYSARESIAAAARRWAAEPEGSLDRFGELLRQSGPDARPVGDVDLLIRTGGEQRLSDFLLWEAAYAELWFTARMWPDFAPEDLAAAIGDYQRRERRFGGLVEPAPQAIVR